MKIVIALGGNALGSTAKEQYENAKKASDMIAELIKEGHQVVVTHGNGPQVGLVNKQMPMMPFPECGAMTQGYIGYHLQNTLLKSLSHLGIHRSVVSLVTQVEVSLEDPAFQNPTKPIGLFLTEEEAKRQAKETGFTFMEDAGRGWRRVVPSPLPKAIVELEAIKALVDAGVVVIASGGGGIPVVKTEEGYEGTAAVIDKDMSGALLADQLHADLFLILTAVDAVYLDYHKPTERALSSLSISDAKAYMEEGQFAKGSMLPKVQAGISFVEKGEDRKVLITSLERAKEAVQGHCGTLITKESVQN